MLADGSMIPTASGFPCTDNLYALSDGYRPRAKRVFARLLANGTGTLTSVVPNHASDAGRDLVTLTGDFGTGANDVQYVILAGVQADIVSQAVGVVRGFFLPAFPSSRFFSSLSVVVFWWVRFLLILS